MSTQASEALLILLLAVLLLGLLAELSPVVYHPAPTKGIHRNPRSLRPRTPDDCPHCQDGMVARRVTVAKSVAPYSQRKSRRGRKKTIDTCGQACPNPDCDYHQITDPAIHALVGYGCHGRRDPIQDFYCQACRHKFSARRHTALYRLRSPATRVAQVLHAVAEGLSTQAAARVFNLSEGTVRRWLTRAGLHSRSLHNRLLRSLHLTHVQLDELRFKVRGQVEAAWLWIACDARTKLIPAFALGPRTQALAHQLIHDVARRLAAGCLPVFSSDGLSLYFFALTAPFGAWAQAAGRRRRTWIVHAGLF